MFPALEQLKNVAKNSTAIYLFSVSTTWHVLYISPFGSRNIREKASFFRDMVDNKITRQKKGSISVTPLIALYMVRVDANDVEFGDNKMW